VDELGTLYVNEQGGTRKAEECIETRHAHALFFPESCSCQFYIGDGGGGKHVSKGNQAVGAPLGRFPSIFATCSRRRRSVPCMCRPLHLSWPRNYSFFADPLAFGFHAYIYARAFAICFLQLIESIAFASVLVG
jgi:hypothetical protein